MKYFDPKKLNCSMKFANNSKNIKLPTMNYYIYICYTSLTHKDTRKLPPISRHCVEVIYSLLFRVLIV